MGAKAFFNVSTREIQLLEAPVNGVVSIDMRVDIFSAAKDDWELNLNGERGHRFPFITAQSAGGELPGGKEEPIFYRLRNGVEGWRFLPFDADHDLTITGTVVPNDPDLPVVSKRAGRTILVVLDGSQVAGLTAQSVTGVLGQSVIASDQKRLMKAYGMVPGASFQMPPATGGPVLEDGVPIADVAGDCDTGHGITGRPET